MLKLSKKILRKNKHLYTRGIYLWNLIKAGQSYNRHNYKNELLFIAGLPKSGTSWLESMVAEYPGYQKNMIPEAIKFEQWNKGSHFLELKKEWFRPLNESLTVLKLHNYGSANNAGILKELDIHYVVLYRDLRDVAVSYYFYVRNTWHHPEYEDYKEMGIEDGLMHFARTLLPEFKKWIYSWQKNIDTELGMMVRYEDLKSDTYGVFKRIVEHYELPGDKKTLKNIIEKYSFENLSDGRQRGEENTSSFFRKGISGDWQNHFTPDLKRIFKEQVGDFLIEFEYENDYVW